MKCISWNVNGIRACITKGFEDRFRELDADIFFQAIISTGIMQTDVAIQELRYLQRKSRSL